MTIFSNRSFKYCAFIITLLLVISFLGYSAGDSSDAQVEWELVGCWVELNWIEGSTSYKSLGTIDNYYPGTEINSQSSHKLQAKTNCRGYSVDVKATQFDLPAGHLDVPGDALSDFSLHIDEWSEYKSFSEFEQGLNMIQNDTPGTSIFDIYYRYLIDEKDVSGDYTVYLTYTISSE